MTSGLQIELTNETNTNSHGIYTVHTATENANNKFKIAVWEPTEVSSEVSVNDVLILTATEMANVVHILPMNNEEYNIGNDDKRWLFIIGSQMFNDTVQSKTVSTHSGR